MVRKSIFDILETKYDISNEFDKITLLFHNPMIEYTFSVGYNRTATQSYTLEQIVENVFHEWKSRGTCISYKNMRAELGIDDIIKQRKKNKDEIIFCLEYYENINNFFINRVAPQLSNYKYKLKNEWEIFIQNIKILLDHLNYKRIEFEEEERVLLVPRNPAAKAVAEISSDDVAFAILKYHHASLKGQLEEKRKLLLSIANEYEPLLKRPIDGFKDYFDKATNMLNNMNIRHNNKSGNNKKELVAQMDDEELENWYDELYQLLLFCILIKDNKDRKGRIDELLKRINSKPD